MMKKSAMLEIKANLITVKYPLKKNALKILSELPHLLQNRKNLKAKIKTTLPLKDQEITTNTKLRP